MVNILSWLFVRRLMVLVAIVALPVTGYAQDATLTGTVTDSTGGVLPGVTVTAIHQASGNTVTAVTDERGAFRLPGRVGNYKITVELAGFTTVNKTVELAVGQTTVTNFQLSAGGVQETITVTGAAPLVDTTKSSMGGTVNPRQMDNIPLNGRNWMDLTLMAPGSNMNAVGDVPTLAVGANSGNYQINIDGQQVTQTMFNTFGQAHFSRDAIAEMEVSGRFDASQGRSSGIQVNAITKSGTNRYEGIYSGFFRSDKFNAPDFINGVTTIGAPVGRSTVGCTIGAAGCNSNVQPYSNQTMTWTYGGPIKKDKIHFFGNYDFSRQPQTYPYNTPYPSFNLDQQFTTWDRKGGGRLDFQLSTQTHLAVRGNHSFYTEPVATGNAGTPVGGNALHPSTPVITERFSNDLFFTLTQVLNNRMLNEVKGGYAGFYWTRTPIVTGWKNHPFGLDVGTPILTFTGPFTIGQAHNNSPQKWGSDPYNIRDDFTLTFNKAGRHIVKLGSEYIADLLNVFVCNICMGQYDMQAVGIPIPANIEQIIPVWNDVNTWNLAALSRNTRNYTVGLGQMKVYNKRQVYSGWAQDNWEFSKVTLSLGLRYDFSTGRELQTAIEPLFGARPSDKTNFGPRLGITYSLNDKTVLRGGYGKYYGAPDDNEAMWTMLYAGEIHPQVNNDGRADFAANPFNGPIPTYAQAMASWQADVASGCAARTGAAGCKFNRIINILSPPNPTTPYSHQGSVGLQRQLGMAISVESDFTINDTRGAQNGQNVNQAFNPATGFNYPYTDRSKKPYPGWDAITMRMRTAAANNYGWQSALTKRMSNHWQGSATYLYSREYDYQSTPRQPGCQYPTTITASGSFTCSVPVVLNEVIADEWYLSTNQRNRFVFNGILDASHGFQVSGIYFFGDNGYNTATAGVDPISSNNAITRVRADGSIIPRNGINNPDLHRVDMRVQKRFRITSRVGIDGIFEIFNAFNHKNFGTFTISETTVARSNGVLHLGSPAFNNLVAYQPRMMQLGFRATF